MSPVGYQLRHKDFGVFQGELLGKGYWHPMSGQPEQGYLEFRTYEEIAAYRAFLCSKECTQPMLPSDLTIEPYDHHTSAQLRGD